MTLRVQRPGGPAGVSVRLRRLTVARAPTEGAGGRGAGGMGGEGEQLVPQSCMQHVIESQSDRLPVTLQLGSWPVGFRAAQGVDRVTCL